MMAIQTHPMESALSFALDPPKRPWRLSGRSTVAVSLVLLLHAGLGAYLYTMKMNPPHEVNNDPPAIVVTTWTPPKPPPPPPRQLPKQQEQPPIHHPTTIDTTQNVKPLPIEPPPTKLVDTHAELQPPPKIDPGPTLIQNPDWVSRPTALQMTRYYPEAAMENGVGGKVVLSCGVTASGGVAGCQVLSETPAGQGFAAAALKLAGFFKLSPRTENGKAIDGALVRIPLVFNAGD